MAQNIQYGLRWSISLVALPVGAGPMSVPDQQRLMVSSGFASAGNTPPGTITVTSTGNYPTSANITTACNAVATAAAALLNANPQAAQWQQWYQGGG